MALDSDVSTILDGSPQSAKTDAGEVVARSAADAIALDQYTAAKAAASRVHRGLRFTKQRMPGPTPDLDESEAT